MNRSRCSARAGEGAQEEGAAREGKAQSSNRFFRVSKVVGSADMLDSWVAWFRRLNIPCAITKGGGGYSLWRSGEEIGAEEQEEPIGLKELKAKKIVYSFGIAAADTEGAAC
jgi:hypothetical protein